jgi:hypothetical protein
LNHNTLILSGTCEWHKEFHKSGLTFGSIRTKISLPKFEFDFRGKHIAIDNPLVWVNINVNYENNALKKSDRSFLEALDTRKYVIIKDAKITNWEAKPKDSSGNILDGAAPELRFNVDTKAFNIALSDRPYPLVNNCTFSGTVEDSTDSGWIMLKTAYRGGIGQKEIKYRTIPVLNPREFEPTLKGSRVLVLGRACSIMPNKKDKLYILADTIIKT